MINYQNCGHSNSVRFSASKSKGQHIKIIDFIHNTASLHNKSLHCTYSVIIEMTRVIFRRRVFV